MTIWDGGWADQSEPERESEWHDSEVAADSWRGGAQPEEWPEELAGPEYWLNKGMDDANEDRERRRKRRDNDVDPEQ